MEDRQRTTKSILDNYSGFVLDVPNADKKILDDLDTGISILDELPKETILDELAELNEKNFNDEFYDLS
tara:strand:+ start:2517 stop:2723 length:207 start_codon:yes stop_codon:yes gene_type:complete